MPTLYFASQLPVEPQTILNTLDMRRVNAELFPLVRMTATEPWNRRPVMNWPLGQPLFCSWVLLLGILPVDRHRFLLASVTAGEGFLEQSSSSMNKLWRHQRKIVATGGGCTVTDTLDYRPRLALLGAALWPVYWLVFWNRHRRLKALYRRAS